MTKFKEDNIPVVGLKFESDDEKTYYSAIVNVCGYIVMEIISPKVSDKSVFTQTDMVRFSFKSRHLVPVIALEKRLYPIGISRASAREAEIKAFYSKSIGIELLREHSYADGSKHLVYMWDKPTKGI